jgi:transposase
MVTPRTLELAEALAVIEALRGELTSARAELAELRGRVAELEAELAQARKPGPPGFVKPNGPRKAAGEKKRRRKRSGNYARRVEPCTEEVLHAVERCPDCGRKLRDGWEHDRRQVIDLPEVRYIVRDHVRIRRHCGVCGKDFVPKLDLSGEVVGQHRVSVRVMALAAYLRTERRMPLSGIGEVFEVLYGLHLSIGELTRLCAEVAELGREAYEALVAELRSSPVVHADETGWREDGQNGWLWVFLTPKLQLFHRDARRASAIPMEMLGEDFGGIVVSDFLSSYGPLTCEKQRCWVHLQRALRELEETHPEHVGVAKWRAQIRALYAQAAAYREKELAYHGDRTMPLLTARRKARRQFERALMKLARPYLKNKDDPRNILAKRIEQFQFELFVFVEHPEVPPENNAAERGLRPSVIFRKICGGTRSERGSVTMATLRSLFGTWRLQGKHPLQACLRLLASAPP